MTVEWSKNDRIVALPGSPPLPKRPDPGFPKAYPQKVWMGASELLRWSRQDVRRPPTIAWSTEPSESHESGRKMRKINKLVLGLALGAAALEAHAQSERTRWVADDLTTYVRSGPTDEYRIVGSLTSGERVTALESDGDYTRVRAENGDEVWIESGALQAERSLGERVPELEAQVESLSAQLEEVDAQWQRRVTAMTETLAAREARIAELESRNTKLDSRASEARQTVRGLQARLDTQEEDLLMRYFMYGGGVAGVGLLVGLLVPHLPRRGKKRDRWF